MEEKFIQYENIIADLKVCNDKNVSNLERSNLVDKKKLKNEMMDKLNELAREFRKAFHQQITDTTKNAMRENFILTSDLKKLSATTEKLLNQNENLRETVSYCETKKNNTRE